MDHDAVLALVSLLHPRGYARRTAIIGAGVRECGRDRRVDVILLVPSTLQWQDSDWRARTLGRILALLAPDGIVFAIPPGRRQRRSMLAAVKNTGLSVVEQVALLPDLCRARQLMPLAPAALAYELVRAVPRAEPVAAAAARLASSTRSLELLLPAVGYVVQPRGSEPLVRWLGPPHGRNRGAWLVRGSWRGPTGAAVVLGLDTSSPGVERVAKVTSGEAAAAEVRALRAAADGGTPDRVRTPKLLGSVRLGDRSAIVEEGLDGQPGAVWLAHRPERLSALLGSLVHWLEQWARASRCDAVLEPSELEASVLMPAEQLAPMLDSAQPYIDWLTELGEQVVGTRVAHTAAHNDLTMWNVLVTPSGRLAVLDWAESAQRALPLGDLAYSVVDAVACTRGYRSRPEAFAACFTPGRRRPDAAGWLRQLAASLGLSAEAQALCFQACWLGHAVNELQQDGGHAGPFVAIVRRIAAQPSAFGPDAERS